MTESDDKAAQEAIGFLDAAEEAIRRVKLSTTAVTVHWIDVARLHCKATIADCKRAELP